MVARARDDCLVPTAPLSTKVSAFIDAWHREKLTQRGQFTGVERGRSVDQLTALEWLEAESGIPARTIRSVVSARHRTTELRTADALMAAIGCPQAFYDGTLTVYARRTGSCCGALPLPSLTGTLRRP